MTRTGCQGISGHVLLELVGVQTSRPGRRGHAQEVPAPPFVAGGQELAGTGLVMSGEDERLTV